MADEGIKFQDFFLTTATPGMTVAEAFRLLTAYGDVHDIAMDNLLDDDQLSAALWTVYAGSFGFSTGYATASGIGSGAEGVAFYDTEVPADGALTLVKTGNDGGLIFRADDENNYYQLWWTASATGFSRIRNGSETVLTSLPRTFTGQAEIRLQWYETRFSTIDEDYWLLASAWIDGEQVVAMRHQIDEDNAPGLYFGLSAGDGVDTFYSNIMFDEFCEPLEWSALEIGDAPMSALNTILQYRVHRMVALWDGTLRSWKPKESDTDMTLSADDYLTFKVSEDRRRIVTHYRMVGAWEQADAHDEDLQEQYGHRFVYGNNPYLLTRRLCYEEAVRQILASQEEANTLSISGPLLVFLEKEDVIETPEGTYIIDEIRVEASSSALEMSVTARKYVYGA